MSIFVWPQSTGLANVKTKKIFNQNAVLVDDGGQEKVAIGKGIGFDRKRNDLIFDRDVERIFVMEPEGQIKLQNLLNQIDERFLFAAETIIDHAETVLMEKLNRFDRPHCFFCGEH